MMMRKFEISSLKDLELQPSETLEAGSPAGSGKVLLIACGALAREIIDLIDLNRWEKFDIQCLPAKWHNTPQFIVPAIREKIAAQKQHYLKIFVLYGDCGTGGQLDALLDAEGVERIPGPHCYSFFTGNDIFATREDDDMTSFFLTDYLARHFDKLMWQGLGLDRHPELLPDYFKNYTKLVYLAQTKDDDLALKAEAAAGKLGLSYEYRFTGYGDLGSVLKAEV